MPILTLGNCRWQILKMWRLRAANSLGFLGRHWTEWRHCNVVWKPVQLPLGRMFPLFDRMPHFCLRGGLVDQPRTFTFKMWRLRAANTLDFLGRRWTEWRHYDVTWKPVQSSLVRMFSVFDAMHRFCLRGSLLDPPYVSPCKNGTPADLLW